MQKNKKLASIEKEAIHLRKQKGKQLFPSVIDVEKIEKKLGRLSLKEEHHFCMVFSDL